MFLLIQCYVATCNAPIDREEKKTARKRCHYECIATWGSLTSRQPFWAVFGQICTAHAHKLLFSSFASVNILRSPFDSATRFPKIEQQCVDQITFSGVFSTYRWKSAIFLLPIYLIYWTRVTCCAPLWGNFHQVCTRSSYLLLTYNVLTADTLCHAVTFIILWRLTPWSWTSVVYQMSSYQTMYQIWVCGVVIVI